MDHYHSFHSDTCPVAMLEQYIAMGSVGTAPDMHLFRGIVHTKSGEKLLQKGSLSYTHMRELLLQKLAELGLGAKQFGLHSLRSGGALAPANAGVPDRLFKRHGRWGSKTPKIVTSKTLLRADYPCLKAYRCLATET